MLIYFHGEHDEQELTTEWQDLKKFAILLFPGSEYSSVVFVSDHV